MKQNNKVSSIVSFQLKISRYTLSCFLLIVLFFINCTNTNQNDYKISEDSNTNSIDSPPIFNPILKNKKEFDSIKYFKDIDFVKLKGKYELNESGLSYPYGILAYKGNDINLYMIVDKGTIMTRKYHKKSDITFYSGLNYDSHENSNSYYSYIYKKNSDFLLTISSSSKSAIDSLLAPNALVFYRLINDSTIEQDFFGTSKKIQGNLYNLLNLTEKQLERIYTTSHQKKIFSLKKDKIVGTTITLKNELDNSEIGAKKINYMKTNFKTINYYFFFNFYR